MLNPQPYDPGLLPTKPAPQKVNRFTSKFRDCRQSKPFVNQFAIKVIHSIRLFHLTGTDKFYEFACEN